MASTLDRKERFILSFGKPTGSRFGNDGVSQIVNDFGLEAFQDWAIDLMIADLIATARLRIRLNNQNRRITARQLAGAA